MDQLLEIDTFGTCLICLKVCDDDKLQTENLGRSAAIQGISDTTLKSFLRYLQIDASKLTDNTDSLSSSARVGSLFCRQHDGGPPTMTMEVNTVGTCSRCYSVMNDFLALFQSFEKVRLRLAECVETVHDLIKEGESDEERVREFRRRKMIAVLTQSFLGGDAEGRSRDVLKLNVERLRRETLEKCALRRKQSIPQIVAIKRQFIDEDSNGGNSPSSSQASADQDLDDEDEDQLTNELLLTVTEDDGENVHSSNEYFALEFFCSHGKLSCVRSSSTRPPQHHNTPAKKSKPDTPSSQKERNFNAVSIGLPNGKYKCRVCERQLPSRLLCDEHYKDQHKEKCFKCSFCRELFPSQLHRKIYEEHLLLAHPLQTRLELPKYTSERQLEQVLAAICEQKRFMPSSSSFYGCPVCPRAIPVNKLKLHLLQCHIDEIVKGLTTLHEGTNARKWPSGESECSLCSKEVDNLRLHMLADHPLEAMRGRLPPQTSEQDLEAALRMNVGMKFVWHGKKGKEKKHQCCTYCHRSYFYSPRQTGIRNHILEKHLDQVLKTLQKMKPNLSPALPDPVQPMEVEESTKPVKEQPVKNIMSTSRTPAQIPNFVRENVLHPSPVSKAQSHLTTSDSHLDGIIERLTEAENEIREEIQFPLPLEVKIEECDMGEVNVEENEDLTIHPEQDPLAI